MTVRRVGAIRIFLTLMVCYAFFTNDFLTTNDASRFSLTVAATDTGSAEVGNILPRVISPYWRIKDYAKIGDRIYTDKAPFGSFLAAPLYYIASRMRLPLNLIVFFVSLFTSGLASAMTSVMIYNYAKSRTGDEMRAAFAAFAYGLGSMAFFYGTVFFSHSITAFCCFASFCAIDRAQEGDGSPNFAMLAGALAGAAFTSDYFSAISVVCLAGYAVSGRKHIVVFFLAMTIPIALLLLYNNICFGSPWTLSYKFSNLYDSLHSSGFFGLTIPTTKNLARLAEILFAPWGLFFANSVLFLSIAGFRKFAAFRRQAVMVAIMAAGYLYLNSCESWLDAYSARFFMPLIPFMAIPIMHLDFSNRSTRNAALLVLGFSIVVSFVGADAHLRERMAEPYEFQIGMKTLAWRLLGPSRLKPGFQNLLFVIIPLVPIWAFPFKKRTEAK